jgi:hypothetical protein
MKSKPKRSVNVTKKKVSAFSSLAARISRV